MTTEALLNITLSIAQMAATLEAGDRAHTDCLLEAPERYVARARLLFDAADTNMATSPSPARGSAERSDAAPDSRALVSR